LNSAVFIKLLQHPEKIGKQHLDAIQQVIETFPYFQAARAIYLKGLKDNNSILYNKELKKTAAYTTDRSLLFEYITSAAFTENTSVTADATEFSENEAAASKTLHESVKKELQKADAILNPNLFERKAITAVPTEETLNPEAPLPFSKTDTYSFQEWLKLTAAEPIVREKVPKKDIKTHKFALIDKFIQENPKIDPRVPASSENLAKPYVEVKEALMTETLAKVYVQQKNYKKAIQAYKILILKNPEKSGFFADQIRAIEKLQDNK
jgi:hypothetical protein